MLSLPANHRFVSASGGGQPDIKIRSCSEITCTYDAGQTFICKEENAAVAGIRHEVAPALAGDGVLMPPTARLSNAADERLDKSDVQVIL